MRFAEFERHASRAFEEIPESFREGIDGLVVTDETRPNPDLPGVFTLGACETESYLSDWDGPETVRSVVVLHYGSFRDLAREDPEFDWMAEIHETVEHEVRHHLESLAGEDDLAGVDYAMDEAFKRGEGALWDPWYYQHGDAAGGGAFAVEDQLYIEKALSAEEFEEATHLDFRWKARGYRIPKPSELGDLHFIAVVGGVLDPPRHLELVLVRRRSWWDDAKRLFSSSRPRVLESEATAEPS